MSLLPALLVLAQVAGGVGDKPATAPRSVHPVVEALKSKRAVLTDKQVKTLQSLPIESVWSALKDLGYARAHISGLRTTQPGVPLVGQALTMRYLPKRPDLEEAMKQLAAEGDWPNGWHVRGSEEVKPGDVIVVDLGGEVEGGVFFGDISALAAQVAGARGVVLWGSSRDLTELKAMKGFPVFAVGFDPQPATQIGVDWNVPIRVGPVTVLPGDAVVADDEAVFFFPANLADQVIEKAGKIVEKEIFERSMVRTKKHRFRDVYPLNPALQAEFEKQQKSKHK